MNMSMPLDDIEIAALKLPLAARSELAERLTASIEAETGDNRQEVAKAWDAEIARRLADLQTGRGDPVPYDDVRAELQGLIAAHRKT